MVDRLSTENEGRSEEDRDRVEYAGPLPLRPPLLLLDSPLELLASGRVDVERDVPEILSNFF